MLSGLRGLVRGGHLRSPHAQKRVDELAHAPLLRIDLRELLADAWLVSDAVSACDAPYVALARREAIEVVTTDAKLARGAAGPCDVRLLSSRA